MQKEMNKWLGPKVKHVWNVAEHVLHNYFGFIINTAAYHLGQYEHSSPYSKELH